MTRYLVAFLIVILLALVVLAFSPKANPPKPLPLPAQSIRQTANITPSPAVPDMSDQALQDDLTALDKDLETIQSSEPMIDKEINSL